MDGRLVAPGVAGPRRVWMTTLDYAELVELEGREVPEVNRKQREMRLWAINSARRVSWFCGLRSAADADRVVREGWPEGTAKALAMKEKLEVEIAPAQCIRRRPRWAEEGEELDMQRVYAGALDVAWRTTKRVSTVAPRVVSIAAMWGGHEKLHGSQMFWPGAAMLVMADLLENAGYRAELWAVSHSSRQKGRGEVMTRVKLKDADSPLVADTVAACSAHGGVFRHYAPLAIETAPFTVSDHHGIPVDPAGALRALARASEIDEPDIMVPPFLSERGVAEWIVRAIERLGDSATMTGAGVAT